MVRRLAALAGEHLAGHMLAAATQVGGDGGLFDASVVRLEQGGEFVVVPFRGLRFEPLPSGAELAEPEADRLVSGVGCLRHGAHSVTSDHDWMQNTRPLDSVTSNHDN